MSKLYFLVGASVAAFLPALASAQVTQPTRDGSIQEIIVTARKRPETLLNAPVAISAFSGAELQRKGISRVDEIARATPLMITGESSATAQGGAISLRGIAGPDSQPFGDQAISFNIDGVTLARSTVRRLGQMDMATVEILKGPQSVFYGKNSPGGVISIRSADPTDHFDAKVTVGYEAVAREFRSEGYVSGPISDTVGLRFAYYASDMTRGWLHNNAVESNGVGPSFDWGPKQKEFAGRFTAAFSPSDRFQAKLKFTYNVLDGPSPTFNSQLANCPLGAPQRATTRMDCKVDNQTSIVGAGPRIQNIFGGLFGGRYLDDDFFAHFTQKLSSLEMNYHLNDQLTLTSISGSYFYDGESIVTSTSFSDIPQNLIMAAERLRFRDLNQEFRLGSSYAGPVNFVAGVFFQKARATYNKRTFSNGVTPVQTVGSPANARQGGKTYSALAQIIYKPVPEVEIDVGGRWTQEEKNLAAQVNGIPVNVLGPHQTVKDVSPEITLAWRPDPDLNVYGSYKEGFLSGGYNAGAADFSKTNSYGPETISGVEGGIKGRLLDRTVRMNLGAYSYKISGLQVSTNVPSSPTTVSGLILNAGRAVTRGVDLDGTWNTPVSGLSLNGALSYNYNRYKQFQTTCYRGQNQQLGCNLTVNALGVAQNQSLAGRQIVRSPAWGAAMGAAYETPADAAGWRVGLSADANYSSSFWADANMPPNGKAPAYWLFDLGFRVFSDTRGWELGLLAKNITNERVFLRSTEVSGSGSAPGTLGPSILPDIGVTAARGREFWVRLSWRPTAP